MSVPDELPERIWWCFTCRAGVGVWGVDSPVPPPRCPGCHEARMSPVKFVPAVSEAHEWRDPEGRRRWPYCAKCLLVRQASGSTDAKPCRGAPRLSLRGGA